VAGPCSIHHPFFKEKIMSLFTEIIGAVVAVEGVKAVDANASLLEEGIAAFTGFKGVEALTEHLQNKPVAGTENQ